MLKKALLVALFAVIAWFLLQEAERLGAFKHFYRHHPGKCRKLSDERLFGSEDFQVTSGGLAFITSGVDIPTSGPAYKEFLSRQNVKGQILSFDFNKPDDGVTKLGMSNTDQFNPATFRPHGISLLEDKDKGEHLLYVINHPNGEPDRVEKFQYLPKKKEIKHLKSFFSETFHTLNDLALVEEDVFYTTDFMYSSTQLLATLETLAHLPLGSIHLFEGETASTVVPYLFGPNGILASPDGRTVYVNMVHNRQMTVYSRDPGDNSLTLSQTVDLNTMADNLHLTQSGDALLSGCHPIPWKIFGHMQIPDKSSAPSQVLHIPLSQGRVVPEDITELLYDHGDLISGSSVAAIHNDLLLVGSVINSLVLCDLKGSELQKSSNI